MTVRSFPHLALAVAAGRQDTRPDSSSPCGIKFALSILYFIVDLNLVDLNLPCPSHVKWPNLALKQVSVHAITYLL